MGILDKLKSMMGGASKAAEGTLGGVAEKASGMAEKAGEVIGGAVDKAADAVDGATKGKFSDQIDKVREVADKIDGSDDEAPAEPGV
jgi:hypothetical protein